MGEEARALAREEEETPTSRASARAYGGGDWRSEELELRTWGG